jgi:hypothetical protein
MGIEEIDVPRERLKEFKFAFHSVFIMMYFF